MLLLLSLALQVVEKGDGGIHIEAYRSKLEIMCKHGEKILRDSVIFKNKT